LQIEIRLNCHILGRNALSDFHFANLMPVLAVLFRAVAQRGFQRMDGFRAMRCFAKADALLPLEKALLSLF
jgi:hypothetical protein